MKSPEHDRLKVQITFSLFDLKFRCEQTWQERIFANICLPVCSDCIKAKTENLPPRFISDADHVAE